MNNKEISQEQWELVKKYFDAAAKHYAYESFDTFIRDKDNWPDGVTFEKVASLAGIIQDEVHKAEFSVIERMFSPIPSFKKKFYRKIFLMFEYLKGIVRHFKN